MVESARHWGPVLVALALALGITGVLVVGLPGSDGTPANEIPGGGGNGTAVPLPDTATGGEPPGEADAFPTFKEDADKIGFEYESDIDSSFSAGVYVVDYNNNGYEDILALGGENPVLFENTGDGYEPVREFDHDSAYTAHFLDYDNNGWRDLVIAEFGGEMVLYENEGGSFEKRPDVLDVSVTYPVSMTSADFDGNGCLDLFLGQRGLWQQGHPVPREQAQDVAEHHPDVRPDPIGGTENRLFYGDCSGFTEVTDRAGIGGERYTLAVSGADFTGNGFPDIHVGNEFGADILYENRGNGTFTRRKLGPATDVNTMASVAKDVTGNHRLDLFGTAIYFPDNVEPTKNGFEPIREAPVPEGNYFLVNENGTGESVEFTNMASEYGLDAGGWGWAATVEDYNNDGHLDVVHSTSKSTPVEPYDGLRRIQAWRGLPDTWENVDGEQVGLGAHDALGIASVDYQNDGALDIAVATTPISLRGGGSGTVPFAFYENQLDSDESLQLWVRNPDGLERNAVVLVETNRRTLYRVANARSDFRSQDSRLIHVGLAHEELEEVRVLWPDGTESTYGPATLNAGNRYILTPDSVERVE